jgi:hypothetical protein
MAVSNRVSSATKNFLLPKLVDTVVTGNKVCEMFLKNAKPWGGAQMEIPIKYALNANNGSFSGFSTLPTAAVDNTVKMTFDAKFNNQSVVLPKTDIALNNTPEQVADLMERQVASDAYDFALTLATQLYGDGTGNSNMNITGLAAAVDDGTNVATYGNLSRSTYSSLNATLTASGGTLTLAKMYTLWDTLQQGNQVATMILTTKAVRSLYEQLLVPNVRYSDSDSLKIGATKLAFRGAEVAADSACTSGKMFMLNEDTFQFYALKKWQGGTPIQYAPEAMDGEPNPSVVTGLGFFETDWREPINQQVMVMNIIHGGNLICKNPRYNGALTGITTI